MFYFDTETGDKIQDFIEGKSLDELNFNDYVSEISKSLKKFIKVNMPILMTTV